MRRAGARPAVFSIQPTRGFATTRRVFSDKGVSRPATGRCFFKEGRTRPTTPGVSTTSRVETLTATLSYSDDDRRLEISGVSAATNYATIGCRYGAARFGCHSLRQRVTSATVLVRCTGKASGTNPKNQAVTRHYPDRLTRCRSVSRPRLSSEATATSVRSISAAISRSDLWWR